MRYFLNDTECFRILNMFYGDNIKRFKFKVFLRPEGKVLNR